MPDPVTPSRLIEVAIDLFGRHGPDAVSTRAIALAAGAQLSAISYHFSSKDQLYLACAEHIAAGMHARIAPLLEASGRPATARNAAEQIENLLCGLAVIMMQDDIAPLARFVVREQMNPSPAFTVLYDGAMRHVVGALACWLHIIAGDSLTETQRHVRCIALLGQAFAFRFAHAALLRSTGWQQAGPRETEQVRQAVSAHTRAIVSDLFPGREP